LGWGIFFRQKIGRVHQRIADHRQDWHFKLAHHLCDNAGMMIVEDLDFRIMAKGMLGENVNLSALFIALVGLGMTHQALVQLGVF
ncbi:MAG: hypothetical protein Q6L68_09720, partial [Thermostichus sp. DG02_5_bins_236]